MIDHVRAALDEATAALRALRSDEAAMAAVAEAGGMIANAFRQGARVYSCGNGGSMCDAMHFAEELSGKFRSGRRPLPALAISDAAHLTCAANDFGFDEVFSRFVAANARKGDVLLAISTSGTSANVMKAVKAAKEAGASVLALTGRRGSPIGAAADLEICTPGGTQWSDRVQELHIKVIHTLIEVTERLLFPELYGPGTKAK
jgi:D-sedoheptulose 7-phosphate isomerase